MKLVANIAGIRKDDPRRQDMLAKKAGLQAFCEEYETILCEVLPQYGVDGILPAVWIVPDRKTTNVLKEIFRMISVGIFERQPPFEWVVKTGAFPCRKVDCGDAEAIYVCGLPKAFPADRRREFAKKLREFYSRWISGCDIRPGLVYQLRDE